MDPREQFDPETAQKRENEEPVAVDAGEPPPTDVRSTGTTQVVPGTEGTDEAELPQDG